MANVIKILKSLVTGNVPSSLQHGQLAINQKDRKLFYPDENGNVKTFNLESVLGIISFTQVVVDFGVITSSENNKTITVANTAVLSTSKIICQIASDATADHSTDEIMLLNFSAYATNIIQGVSFDIQVYTPEKTYGQVKVNYLITN